MMVVVAFGEMLRQLHPSDTLAAAKAASSGRRSVRFSISSMGAPSGSVKWNPRYPRGECRFWISGPGLEHAALVTVTVEVEVVTVLR